MSSKRYDRKKRIRQLRRRLILLGLFVVLTTLFLYLVMERGWRPWEDLEKWIADISTQESRPGTEEPEEEKEELQTENTGIQPTIDLEEKDIYTFLQGPKAWASKAPYSGAWCEEHLAGQKFSVFGCGLCVLANIYSTLTPYDCSPLDMYDYAQRVSGYRPVNGFGAIDWPYLVQTLESVGIHSELKKTDGTYQTFQKDVSDAVSVIALISSYYDDAYWQDVEGHYINLWLYDAADDSVFLADSGNPSHNRQRISLSYIYKALKISGEYQYLLVTGIDTNGNTWKHDGIDTEWTPPSWYTK